MLARLSAMSRKPHYDRMTYLKVAFAVAGRSGGELASCGS
jgi:hypothetical protein